MSYKPRTSAELNQYHIEKTLKKLKNGGVSIQECGLNRRFDRLREQNIGMWEELYPKYISIVREKSLLKLD